MDADANGPPKGGPNAIVRRGGVCCGNRGVLGVYANAPARCRPGDTGGFQAAVLWPEQSARRAYPLYYTLAMPFIRAVSEDNAARGLNLFSAIWAAIAVGLLAVVGGRLTKSPLAGAAAGLLLAFSHTFWTQAIIAEVYSLHLALIAARLIALHAYAARLTTVRLAVFFALYAVAFGNHLGMILFLVPFTVFLIQVHPRPRGLVAPSTILLAVVIAVARAAVRANVSLRMVVHRRAARVGRPHRRLLARRHQSGLARGDGPRRASQSTVDPIADVGLGRTTAVRPRRPRARPARCSPHLVVVDLVGATALARLRDLDGVCAHLQRRRYARLSAARPFPAGPGSGGGHRRMARPASRTR